MKKISLFGLLLYFISCASFEGVQQRLNTWTGKSEKDLLFYYGSPVRTYNMDDGTKVLTFSNSQFGVYSTQSQRIQSYNYNCNIDFYIKNGIIISWRYEGNYGGCDPLAKAAPKSLQNASLPYEINFPFSDKINISLMSISLAKYGPMKNNISFRAGDNVFINLNLVGLTANNENKVVVQADLSIPQLNLYKVNIVDGSTEAKELVPMYFQVPIKSVTKNGECNASITIRDMVAKKSNKFQTKFYLSY